MWRAGTFLAAVRVAVFVAVLTMGPLSAAIADTPGFSLQGNHAFTIEHDGPDLKVLEYDDIQWRRIPVPASWKSLGIPGKAEVGWYRIRFKTPENWGVAKPAIRLGLISRPDETFLNGVRIGGEGIVGARGSMLHNMPPFIPRLYPFDKALLSKDGDNVLAVRVARFPYIDEGGIVSGPVALVDYTAALPVVSAQIQRFAGLDLFLFGIETLVLLVALVAFALGVRDRVMTSFILVFAPYYCVTLEEQYFIHFLGFNSVYLQLAVTKLGALVLVPLVEFVAAVCNRPVGRIGRILQAATLVVSLTFPTGVGSFMTSLYIASGLVWSILLIANFLLIMVWTLTAIWRRQSSSIALLAGLMFMVVMVMLDILLPTNALEAFTGMQLGALGFTVFLFSLAGILGLRMRETERALQLANARALKLHEHERGRLARDVHDGIGQWLSTIKLNLKMLKSDNERGEMLAGERLDDLVGEVTHAIEDTRRIAHDLSPALLEKHGLVNAMRSHADRMSRHHGIAVEIDAPADLAVASGTRDHLYRIFQEALRNAVEHGQAKRIDAVITPTSRQLELSVTDDGVGLETLPGFSEAAGLGLQNISERTVLLGGCFDVRPGDGGGTVVVITVPKG